MKKVAVLTLVATLNLGGAAGELIFSDGFESGWPNAWAAAAGWSAFVVKDSAGALVGPVVGFQTYIYHVNDEDFGSPQVPLVAVWIGGDKVLFKVYQNALTTGNNVHFELPSCEGQAKIMWGGGSTSNRGSSRRLNELLGAVYAIGPGNVVYKAEPPNTVDLSYESSSAGHYTAVAGCGDSSGELHYRTWGAVPIGDLNHFTPPFTVE